MFWLMYPSAFFRCFMSNARAHTELGTEPFIQSMGIDGLNFINYNWVQVLSYSKYSLLLTYNLDWTCNLLMISLSGDFQPNPYIHCSMCPAGRLEHCEYNNKDEDNSPNILSDKKRAFSAHYMFELSSRTHDETDIGVWL